MGRHLAVVFTSAKCFTCFTCFPAPTHLIQMHGRKQDFESWGGILPGGLGVSPPEFHVDTISRILVHLSLVNTFMQLLCKILKE